MHGSRPLPPSRRRFLAAALALGAGAIAAPGVARLAHAATAPAADLIRRKIPSTGEALPVIGLGTNAFGVEAAHEIAARGDVVARMVALGGAVIDTARAYGRSEEVLGGIVEKLGVRDRLFIATKAPMTADFSNPAAVVEESFRRLRVQRIDLVQVHNLGGLDALMPALAELKAAKRIRYVGISTSRDEQYADFLAAMRKYPLDFVQVDYSLGDRTAEREILPLAADEGIAVLANMPLGGRRGSLLGSLAGRPLPGVAGEVGATSWAQLLLKYAVSHPAVTCAIPGTTKVRNLEDNQQAGRGVLPDAAQRRRIEAAFGAA